ncbi:hypothetical protein EVAR_77873_1 [Eumeta japonica]|uniref:Uncharacterized protein n=1 Tax=Eumeta variegata TaxID=151549 RepID=A0A4C1TEF2_EUMVA|nr:hypothetical protein EVAR_77873_1 [Eumeta japonica]
MGWQARPTGVRAARAHSTPPTARTRWLRRLSPRKTRTVSRRCTPVKPAAAGLHSRTYRVDRPGTARHVEGALARARTPGSLDGNPGCCTCRVHDRCHRISLSVAPSRRAPLTGGRQQHGPRTLS